MIKRIRIGVSVLVFGGIGLVVGDVLTSNDVVDQSMAVIFACALSTVRAWYLSLQVPDAVGFEQFVADVDESRRRMLQLGIGAVAVPVSVVVGITASRVIESSTSVSGQGIGMLLAPVTTFVVSILLFNRVTGDYKRATREESG